MKMIRFELKGVCHFEFQQRQSPEVWLFNVSKFFKINGFSSDPNGSITVFSIMLQRSVLESIERVVVRQALMISIAYYIINLLVSALFAIFNFFISRLVYVFRENFLNLKMTS